MELKKNVENKTFIKTITSYQIFSRHSINKNYEVIKSYFLSCCFKYRCFSPLPLERHSLWNLASCFVCVHDTQSIIPSVLYYDKWEITRKIVYICRITSDNFFIGIYDVNLTKSNQNPRDCSPFLKHPGYILKTRRNKETRNSTYFVQSY